MYNFWQSQYPAKRTTSSRCKAEGNTCSNYEPSFIDIGLVGTFAFLFAEIADVMNMELWTKTNCLEVFLT